MERAGQAALSLIKRLYPDSKTLSVVAGGGHNGGDGYVLARFAFQTGFDVRVYPAVSPSHLKGDALTAYEDFSKLGVEILPFIPHDFEGTEILVDALFGTGLNRVIDSSMLPVIGAINRYRWDSSPAQSRKRVVFSLDIPSGLNSETGVLMGAAVKADVTLTFVGKKQGLFTGDGPEYSGNVYFDDLETRLLISKTPTANLFSPPSPCLPVRSRSSHKGMFGHVLVLGGGIGMGGAPRLTAYAAARTGSGLISIGTTLDNAVVDHHYPELMVHALSQKKDFDPLLKKATVVALGPGLGQTDWGKWIFAASVESSRPRVIDADALNLLAVSPRKIENSVLTPHPGEAGRLLGISTADIQKDRFAAVEALHRKYNSVIVLKGSGTLVFDGNEVPTIIQTGNPGMATGGMGDLLTGIISGLIAQGLPLIKAAKLGAYLHGLAGDHAAKEKGEIGLLATDLLPYIHKLLNGRTELP